MPLPLKHIFIALLPIWLASAPVLASEPVEATAPAVSTPQSEPAPPAEPEPEQEPEQESEPEQEPEPEQELQGEQRQAPAFQRQEPPRERSNSSGISLGKIAISLALVVLLVVVLGWLFKKLTMRLPGSQHVKVICSVPLGQRERLLVIEIQGKQRVLGVTPHSINMLFELENSLPETKLASDFHTQLQSFLKK